MQYQADRVRFTTTTVGTGTIDVGAAQVGFQDPATAGFVSADPICICITDGINWEVSLGVYTAGGPDTISRTTVVASSNANALVAFGAGSKDVFVTVPAGMVHGLPYAAATGTADALVATFAPAIPTLYDGLTILVGASAANATTTPTLDVNGLGAQTITKRNGVALGAGDIEGVEHQLLLVYNVSNTSWSLINPKPPATGGGGGGFDNFLPNPSAAVASRGQAAIVTNMSAAYQTGQTDCIAMKCAAVTAGTIANSTISALGVGTAAVASGLSSGVGELNAAVRVEAADARMLVNKTASLQFSVLHDAGVPLTYFLRVSKANAENNFSVLTQIAVSAGVVVESGVASILTLDNIAMGDCKFGLHVECFTTLPVVAAKNFEFTNWALIPSAATSTFVPNDYQRDLIKCARYLPAFFSPSSGGDIAQIAVGSASGTTFIQHNLPYKVDTLKTPTGLISSPVASFRVSDGVTPLAPITIGLNSVTGKQFASIGLSVVGAVQYRPYVFRFNSVGYLILTGSELF